MKRWIHASIDNENSLNQSEFARELNSIKRSVSSTPTIEIEDQILSVIQRADTDVSISVDDRVLSGFGSSGGSAYEFRKVGDNKWSEIFDDYYDVTDKELTKMYMRSKGFKRASR